VIPLHCIPSTPLQRGGSGIGSKHFSMVCHGICIVFHCIFIVFTSDSEWNHSLVNKWMNQLPIKGFNWLIVYIISARQIITNTQLPNYTQWHMHAIKQLYTTLNQMQSCDQIQVMEEISQISAMMQDASQRNDPSPIFNVVRVMVQVAVSKRRFPTEEISQTRWPFAPSSSNIVLWGRGCVPDGALENNPMCGFIDVTCTCEIFSITSPKKQPRRPSLPDRRSFFKSPPEQARATK